MSAISPHSKRLRRRSSISASSRGGRSEAMTICFMLSCSALKVWKNSSWVRSFCGEELDVVDEQQIHGAEAVAEAGHLVVAHGADHLVGELLRGDVGDGRAGLAQLHLMTDGVHEVRLAHAHAAVEEERVVSLGGLLGDGHGGGAGELIAGSADEAVEGVARIELRGGRPVEARLLRAAMRSGASAPIARAAESAWRKTGANPPSSRTRGSVGSSSGVMNVTSSNSRWRFSMASWMRSP